VKTWVWEDGTGTCNIPDSTCPPFRFLVSGSAVVGGAERSPTHTGNESVRSPAAPKTLKYIILRLPCVALALLLVVVPQRLTCSCCRPAAPAQCFAVMGGEPIEACKCHPTCGSCGYNDWPVEENNCIACHAPNFLSPGSDGSGT
jgi:hypothetical protein